jgi:hypothetical protein
MDLAARIYLQIRGHLPSEARYPLSYDAMDKDFERLPAI